MFTAMYCILMDLKPKVKSVSYFAVELEGLSIYWVMLNLMFNLPVSACCFL